MTVTPVVLPADQQKFGKLPAVHDPRVKALWPFTNHYRLAAPVNFRVRWSRKLNVAALGTMLNTQLGDCTAAAKGHAIQLWTAWTSQQAVIPDSVILALYKATSGYNGTPQTDRGAAISSVINYWMQNPIAGHTLSGAAHVEPGNLNDMRNAIWIGGVLDIGLLLPKTCISQAVWRVVSTSGDGAPGSAGGHDVIVIDYDDTQQLFTVVTWGHLKYMSYSFAQAYMDEGYMLTSKEWLLQNQETPSDFNWDQLIAYLNEGF